MALKNWTERERQYESDITERLSRLSRKLYGLGVGTKQAAVILARDEWDDHWPTAAPSRGARYGYVYDGGVVESGDPQLAANGYYNIDDEAMVLVCDVSRNHYDKFPPCCQAFGGGESE